MCHGPISGFPKPWFVRDRLCDVPKQRRRGYSENSNDHVARPVRQVTLRNRKLRQSRNAPCTRWGFGWRHLPVALDHWQWIQGSLRGSLWSGRKTGCSSWKAAKVGSKLSPWICWAAFSITASDTNFILLFFFPIFVDIARLFWPKQIVFTLLLSRLTKNQPNPFQRL